MALQKLTAGTQLSAGGIAKVDYFQTSTFLAITSNIPYDGSIPQISEGTQVMSLSYTPSAIGNLLIIDSIVHLTTASANVYAIASLFDGSANALSSAVEWRYGNTETPTALPLRYRMTVSSLSPISFTVRADAHSGNSTFTGQSGGAYMGGNVYSSLSVMEVNV